MIVRAIALSFILFVSSSKTSRNRATAILKLVLQYYNHLARYDVILDQSDRAHLCNHLSNYNKLKIFTFTIKVNSNLQDFLLEVRVDEDLAEDDDRLNERLDIELIRVIAERNMPSSDGLKQENTLPRAEAYPSRYFLMVHRQTQ